MNPPAETSPPGALLQESPHALAPGVTVAPDGLRVQFSRSGGPGGQNVNKLNTRIELWLTLTAIRGMSPAAVARLRTLAGHRFTDAGEIRLASEVHRSQERNRREVFARLRDLIVEAQKEPKRRKKTQPSAGARRRRLESKRRRSEIKLRRSGRD